MGVIATPSTVGTTPRGRGRAALSAFVLVVLASACTAIVGVADFTGGVDAGVRDGGHVTASGKDAPREDTSVKGDAARSDAACKAQGTGVVGTLGCACESPGKLACNGNAQKVVLICSGGAWKQDSTCSTGDNCDTQQGTSQGTCVAIDPACANATPGERVCSNKATLGTCGPDLVSDVPGQACPGSSPACANGECATCAPGSTRCSGGAVETCGANDQWGSPSACGGGTPFCANGTCAANPPSCETPDSGTSLCGVSGAEESCCTSNEVLGNVADGGATSKTFYRTYTSGSDGGAIGLTSPAAVSTFRLDRYEVTVGRFRQFVNAWDSGMGYLPPPGSGKHTHLRAGLGLGNSDADAGTTGEPGWLASDDVNVSPLAANLACNPQTEDTWTVAPGTQENLPINCVNWYEAYAFCIWDGGFLPSEAEWEYTAAGGSQQREYPWGPTAPTASENKYAIYGCDYRSDAATCTGVVNVANVGTATLGAGLFGQLDLAGNIEEWIVDGYDGVASYPATCTTDCAYLPANPADRMRRGGDFVYSKALLVPPYRAFGAPTIRYSDQGFRCARAP